MNHLGRSILHNAEQAIKDAAKPNQAQREADPAYIHRQAMVYLQEQRDNELEAWRYVYTARSLGVEWSDLTAAELAWALDDLKAQRLKMESWIGTPYTPEQYAAIDVQIADAQAALKGKA